MHWLFSIVFSLSMAFPFLTSIWMTFEWLNSTINCWKEIQSFYIPRVLAGLRISAYCLDNRITWLRIEFDNTAFSRNFRDIALWYLHTECLSLRLLHQWLYWLDLIAWYFFPQEELKSALVLEVFHIWKYLPLALIFEHQCDSSVHSPGGPSTQLADVAPLCHGIECGWDHVRGWPILLTSFLVRGLFFSLDAWRIILEVTVTHSGEAWELTSPYSFFLEDSVVFHSADAILPSFQGSFLHIYYFFLCFHCGYLGPFLY